VRATVEHVPRAIGLVVRGAPGSTAALVGLTLVLAGLPLGIAWVGKALVDAVVARDAERTLVWVAVELGLVMAQVGATRGRSLVERLLGARLSRDVNVRILEKALTLDLRDFEDAELYDQLTRARREASSRPIAVVTETFSIAQNLLTLIGYASLLLALSPLVVGALVVASIPATIAEVHFGRIAFRVRNWRSPDARRLVYLERVLASDDHAKEVKLLGIGPLLLERYRGLSDSFFEEDRGLAIRRTLWGGGLSLLATATFYGAYAWAAQGAARGLLTLGELTLFVASFQKGQQALQGLLSGIGGMHEHDLYLSNLFSYLDRAPSEPRPAREPQGAASATRGEKQGEAGRREGVEESGEKLARDPQTGPETGAHTGEKREGLEGLGGVRFEGVSFRYPGSERWALRDVTLDVPAGTSLALVGHNGAGKTTFIKLLTGLYEPTMGRVLLDGEPVGSLPDHERFRRFSVVFQDFMQLQMTLADNVGLGSHEHRHDEARMERAIARGGASALVGKLEKGRDTQLGKWFGGGVELSGGEWQKVALARSFMREEADVLVLDEPTAALDAEAEHAVFERFRELTRGRTSILISHRFPTVRMADRIVVLDGGTLCEEGTHDELLAKGGTYARLFELQAQGYR
jgi:ATP-binding cassette subfamily B protein